MPAAGIDNEFGIEASWNDRELAKTNDGKSYWTEPYRAKYISTADIAAAQDAALNRAGSESLRISDQARGDFAALLRASNGTQIELPYRYQDEFLQNTNASDLRFTNSGTQKLKTETSAEQDLQSVPDQKAPKPVRKTLKLHAPKKPGNSGLLKSAGATAASTASKNGRTQAKQAAIPNSREYLIGDNFQQANLNLPVRISNDGEEIHSSLERHDSLVPKSEGSDTIDSPKAQTSTKGSTLPTAVVTPVRTAKEEPLQSTEDRSTRASRKRRGNDLTIYGTPSLGSMDVSRKETWYLATDGKNYLLQGDEDPNWIVKTFEVERGAPSNLPNKRSTPGRNNSPGQALRGRSTSRRRAN